MSFVVEKKNFVAKKMNFVAKKKTLVETTVITEGIESVNESAKKYCIAR